jgi:hypothetical protein
LCCVARFGSFEGQKEDSCFSLSSHKKVAKNSIFL